MTLEIRDLRAAYDGLRVLHGVTLAVQPGELIAVLGANGAGKTTLLRTISGLLSPTAGSVLLDGRDIAGRPAEEIARSGLAHVPENRLVFPSLSVNDNLLLGAWTRRRSPGTVAASRDLVLSLFPRLAQRLTQAAGTMSGGEQQMLAIGRGLMASPRVMVLDEPSVGLAPRMVTEIFGALAQLRDRQRLAVLLVEQNARAAFRVADRVYVMDRGRVVLEGRPSELVTDDRVKNVYLGGGYAAPV